jgi:hypothetical protein
VGLGRLELPTYGLGNRRSIHLSYSPESDPQIITEDSGVVHLVTAMPTAARVSQPGACAKLFSFQLRMLLSPSPPILLAGPALRRSS